MKPLVQVSPDVSGEVIHLATQDLIVSDSRRDAGKRGVIFRRALHGGLAYESYGIQR